MKYRYVGRLHDRIAEALHLPERLHGKLCKLLNTWRRHGPHNVLIEFEDGVQVVCSMRCLRKLSSNLE